MMNIPELTVGEFSRSIKNVVEDAFGYVRIKGEISGFKQASSGHLYFNLKDDEGLLNAVCFKNMVQLINFEMADGLAVIASGKISTFGARSNYQIIVEKVEIEGVGAILAMIEKRRQKLAAEGLFDDVNKKTLPFFPRKIGVITSETGAVIQDIVHRVEARCPTHLLLYPSLMQGKESATNVIKAIRYFNKLKKEERPQLLIIARGGGSFEDLLPFNDEDLVREIFKSEIPIISAIGHETDTTLADFVADLRAPTPTAAAELATPVLQDLKSQLQFCFERVSLSQEKYFSEQKKLLENLQKQIIHPANLLKIIGEKFELVAHKLNLSVKNIIDKNQRELDKKIISLLPILHKINLSNQKIDNLATRLELGLHNHIKNSQKTLQNLEKLLDAGHYQKILQRGFAMVKNAENKLISSVTSIKPKQEIVIEMNDGEFNSYVLSCKKNHFEKAVETTEDKPESIQKRLI